MRSLNGLDAFSVQLPSVEDVPYADRVIKAGKRVVGNGRRFFIFFAHRGSSSQKKRRKRRKRQTRKEARGDACEGVETPVKLLSSSMNCF